MNSIELLLCKRLYVTTHCCITHYFENQKKLMNTNGKTLTRCSKHKNVSFQLWRNKNRLFLYHVLHRHVTYVWSLRTAFNARGGERQFLTYQYTQLAWNNALKQKRWRVETCTNNHITTVIKYVFRHMKVAMH